MDIIRFYLLPNSTVLKKETVTKKSEYIAVFILYKYFFKPHSIFLFLLQRFNAVFFFSVVIRVLESVIWEDSIETL